MSKKKPKPNQNNNKKTQRLENAKNNLLLLLDSWLYFLCHGKLHPCTGSTTLTQNYLESKDEMMGT